MKKIIIAILVIAIIAVGVYFLVFSKNNDVKALEAEVEYFVENTASRAEIATKGDLSKVEILLKSDYAKIEAVAKKYKDVAVEDILTAENYAKNSVDFAESKLNLETIKTDINKDIDELKKLVDETEINAKIEENKLSTELAEKYREFLKKSKLDEVIAKLEAEKNVIEEKVNKAEETINHLVSNKDKWKIVENKFEAIGEDFKTGYEKLLNEFHSIGKK